MAGEMNKIFAYRYRENLPLKLDKGEVIGMAKAAGAALKFGMPEVGAKQLANKILLEGRENAGTNEFNDSNPRASKLFNDLVDSGVSRYYARYPAAVLDKAEVAKRLGIPFELAWNGTGKLAANGSDGQRHAARADAMKGADKDPRNTDFVDLINRSMAGNNTPQENLLTMSDIDIVNAIFGPESMRDTGSSYKISDKAASDLTNRAEAIISQLGYNDKQAKEARDAITKDSYRVVGAIPELYRQASGFELQKGTWGVNYNAEQINKSPAAQEVINVLLGVDPGGQLYKDAYARKHPEATDSNDSFLSKIFGK